MRELHTQIVAVSFAVLSVLFSSFIVAHSLVSISLCVICSVFPFFSLAMRRLPTKPLRYGAEEVGGEADLRAAVRLLGRHHRAELAGRKWRDGRMVRWLWDIVGKGEEMVASWKPLKRMKEGARDLETGMLYKYCICLYMLFPNPKIRNCCISWSREEVVAAV